MTSTPSLLPPRLGRDLALWLGSFLVIATTLLVCAHIPIIPLLIAGALTCGATVIRSILTRKRRA